MCGSEATCVGLRPRVIMSSCHVCGSEATCHHVTLLRRVGWSAAVSRAKDSHQMAGAALTSTSARSRTFAGPGPGTASTPGARTRVTATRAMRTTARRVRTATSVGTIRAAMGSVSTLPAATSASVSPDTPLMDLSALTWTSASLETPASMESARTETEATAATVTRDTTRLRASAWMLMRYKIGS